MFDGLHRYKFFIDVDDETNFTVNESKASIHKKYGIPLENILIVINRKIITDEFNLFSTYAENIFVIIKIINLNEYKKNLDLLSKKIEKTDPYSSDFAHLNIGLRYMKTSISFIPCKKEIDSFKTEHRLDDIRIISKENIIESINDIIKDTTIKEKVSEAIWKFAVESGEKIDI